MNIFTMYIGLCVLVQLFCYNAQLSPTWNEHMNCCTDPLKWGRSHKIGFTRLLDTLFCLEASSSVSNSKWNQVNYSFEVILQIVCFANLKFCKTSGIQGIPVFKNSFISSYSICLKKFTPYLRYLKYICNTHSCIMTVWQNNVFSELLICQGTK
jgi:hypothetical protein